MRAICSIKDELDLIKHENNHLLAAPGAFIRAFLKGMGVSNLTDANWIFDAAMRLMDEQQEPDSGNLDMAEYRQRTLGILNVLRHELYPYSSTFEHGRRCPELGKFDQALDLDDDLAQAVLPYGLAAHLLLGEDNTTASFFQQRYTELLYNLGYRRTAQWETITV